MMVVVVAMLVGCLTYVRAMRDDDVYLVLV